MSEQSTDRDFEFDERLFEELHRHCDQIFGGTGSTQSTAVSSTPSSPAFARLLNCLNGLEQMAVAAGVRPAVSTSDSSLSGRRTLGPYDLLEEIGRGGMGIVFRARHRALESQVALKVIRASELASVEEVRRFHQEARAAAGLVHPSIVRVHDAGECDGLHYLTMDLIEGPTLTKVLRQRTSLDARATAELMEPIARAVHYLHQKGIVHRDLKPSNILLDTRGNPFVSDFGLAKVFSTSPDATLSGTIIGTPDYMSPEQAEGRAAKASPSSDVFSLGAILYEMLTGRPPFRGDSPLDTLLAVLESEPTYPRKLVRGVPANLEYVCLRCLEKEPERRYPSAEALANDLQRFLDGEPIARPTTTWQHRAQQSLRREPALWSHWLALGLAAFIVQARAMVTTVEPADHALVMTIFAVWAACSWGLQRWLRLERHADGARYTWAAVDVVLYTSLLLLSERWGWPVDMLLVGYAVMITGAALWFRVRLIWFMTFLSVLSYFLIRWLHPEMKRESPFHYPLIVAAMLITIGANVSYQVERLKRLDRIHQRRKAGSRRSD